MSTAEYCVVVVKCDAPEPRVPGCWRTHVYRQARFENPDPRYLIVERQKKDGWRRYGHQRDFCPACSRVV